MSLFRKLFQHQKCNIIGEAIFIQYDITIPAIVRNAPHSCSARDPRLQPRDDGDPGQSDGGDPGVQRGRGGRGHHREYARHALLSRKVTNKFDIRYFCFLSLLIMFHNRDIEPHITACMSVIGSRVRAALPSTVPVGVQVRQL